MIENRRQKMDDRGQKNLFPVFCFLFFIFCFLLSVLCPLNSYADKIYLKNGKNYDGRLVGKSERRYLFALDTGPGESVQISFFTEDVEKIELGKDTVESQIPYLKEVESLRVEVNKNDPKVYELSLYKESQGKKAEPTFSEQELRKSLSREESEYYQRFNEILKKYVDKFSAVQNIYMNLTTATREDFEAAKQYMDELYFELNNLFVPETFKKSHISYLQSVKASYLAFNALGQGMLDEAAKQIKISEDSKQRCMEEIREIISKRKLTSKEEGNTSQ
ncbi:MAG: hypothetical protein V1840_01610 [Candidatus Omnitrophota bacterium]